MAKASLLTVSSWVLCCAASHLQLGFPLLEVVPRFSLGHPKGSTCGNCLGHFEPPAQSACAWVLVLECCPGYGKALFSALSSYVSISLPVFLI